MNDVKSAITVTIGIAFVITDIIERNMEGKIGVDCLEPPLSSEAWENKTLRHTSPQTKTAPEGAV